MKRFKLTLSYDGTQFFGFQRQKSKEIRTIQGVLEERLSQLLNETIIIHGSGRTDSGVHAMGQVIHFDTNRHIPAEQLQYALLRNLPRDLVIIAVEEVTKDFHARKSSCGKWYRYQLYNGQRPHAIGHMYWSHEPQAIDDQKLQAALKPLIGYHHFQGFCGRGATVDTFERTIFLADFYRQEEKIIFHFIGDGFLRKMVRNIVGTVLDMATGRKKEDLIENALISGDRREGGATAPPEGLFLEKVFYDVAEMKEQIEILQNFILQKKHK